MPFSISPRPEFIVLNRKSQLTTTGRAPGIQVKVFPQWFEQCTIQWSVPASWGEVLFNVYRSEVTDSGFQKLNATPVDGTFFTDTTFRNEQKSVQCYYVVEAILTAQNNTPVRSKPVSWNDVQRNWVGLRATEIQRREYFLLSRFTGAKSYVFRRKTFGKRCPYCWNPNLQLVMTDKCSHCAGTSFENGFANPSPCYIQYDPNNNTLLKSYFGVAEPNEVGAWTISMPEIRPDDIIVRTGSWGTYRVKEMQSTQLQGNPVRQILRLTELSRNNIEYALLGRSLPEFPTQYFEDEIPNYVF